MRNTQGARALFRVAAVLLALAVTSVVLLASGADPVAAFRNIVLGAFGSGEVIANVVVSWVPLLLATAGLLVTFTAGLWNIGIEGQITLGAVFATGALRMAAGSGLDPHLAVALGVAAGALGGALWAMLAGALRTFGGVNEIFGGLGLNFVATALNLWLIFGPWKRPGVASMSGTLPFPRELWMATISDQSRLSLAALVIALLSITTVFLFLRGTLFGLRLKAVGRNANAAHLLGVPTWQYMLTAFGLCGIFAGLAGAVQVTAVYHRLIPSISSGYGYLGLMVAMLSNYAAAVAAPVALFFAALNVGSIRLPIVMQLDSSLAGVLQGTLVFFILLAQGARDRLLGKEAPREP